MVKKMQRRKTSAAPPRHMFCEMHLIFHVSFSHAKIKHSHCVWTAYSVTSGPLAVIMLDQLSP